MSEIPYATLAYGYNIGGADGGWKIVEVDEHGGWNVPWLNPDINADTDSDTDSADITDDVEHDCGLDLLDPDPDENVNPIALAEQQLFASVGFTETDQDADGYRDRMLATIDRLGVGFEPYGTGDEPNYLFAAHVAGVCGHGLHEVDLTNLSALHAKSDWDDRLAKNLAVLGITPTQDKPRWLLVAYCEED